MSNIAHNFANIVGDEDYVMGAMNPAAAGRPSRHLPSPLTGAAATDECALSIARRTKVRRRLELERGGEPFQGGGAVAED